MKKMALLLVLILVLCSAGCKGTSEQQNEPKKETKNAFSSPANIDGYQRADFDKFNSPAAENGLGGTKIYMDGILEDVYILDDTNTLYGTLNSESDKWVIYISLEGDKFLKEAELLEGSNVRIFGVYGGFSSVKKMPVLHFIKLVRIDTLESYHILEFSTEYSIGYGAYLDGVVSSAKELNPKDDLTENGDNLADISVDDLVKKIENKCHENITILDNSTTGDITEYICGIVEKDIAISIEKNNKSGRITTMRLLFQAEFNEQLYCATVQTLDPLMSSEDAMYVYRYLLDNTIKVEDGDFGTIEKNSFTYSLIKTDEFINISISEQ